MVKNILKGSGCIAAIILFIVMIRLLNDYGTINNTVLKVLGNPEKLFLYNSGIGIAIIILRIISGEYYEIEDMIWKIIVGIIIIGGLISFIIFSNGILFMKFVSLFYLGVVLIISWSNIMGGISLVAFPIIVILIETMVS